MSPAVKNKPRTWLDLECTECPTTGTLRCLQNLIISYLIGDRGQRGFNITKRELHQTREDVNVLFDAKESGEPLWYHNWLTSGSYTPVCFGLKMLNTSACCCVYMWTHKKRVFVNDWLRKSSWGFFSKPTRLLWLCSKITAIRGPAWYMMKVHTWWGPLWVLKLIFILIQAN